MTEKIRQLTNRVHLAGAVAELENIREGVTSNGVPYISFNGVIQCGDSQVNRVRFRSFVKSKKADGTDSKNYAKTKKWVHSVVPMTEDAEHPTFVDAVGSIVDHPYVGADGELKEIVDFNLQFFGEFSEYAADIDIEGFIHSIVDEVKGGEDGEATGRQRMRIISRDIFSNTLDIKSIVIPEELVDSISSNGYERGATATFYLTMTPNKKVVPQKTGGIGVQRVEGGKPYLEWVLTGADPVIDDESEQALSPKLIKAAMVERQSKLEEIKQAGYLGGKSSGGSASVSESASGSTLASTTKKAKGKAKTMSEIFEDTEDDDDDLPF